MNSQTKPEIGRKKPQKPKKATFTKGCAVSSGGGGGTIILKSTLYRSYVQYADVQYADIVAYVT